MYRYGMKIKEEELKLIKKAADKDLTEAIYRYSQLNKEKNNERSDKYLKKSAYRRDNQKACTNMASISIAF